MSFSFLPPSLPSTDPSSLSTRFTTALNWHKVLRWLRYLNMGNWVADRLGLSDLPDHRQVTRLGVNMTLVAVILAFIAYWFI